MKTKADGAGYNERLFDGGVRKYLHLSRFYWIKNKIISLKCNTDKVVELGCFDGKVIEFLPKIPDVYLGFDSNWEQGLDLAKKKWHEYENISFSHCDKPDQFLTTQIFDISVCMSTLEHVPREMINPYLEKLSSVTDKFIFITVPNEIGIVFILKWLYKRLWGDYPHYTFKEIFYTMLGKTEMVSQNQHKGFNYKFFIKQVSKYSEVIDIVGYPFAYIPPILNFGIGIVGRKRQR